MFDVDYFVNSVYMQKSNRLKEKFIQKNFNEFYQFIDKNYTGDTFLEKVYIFVNGNHKCHCGNKTKFISFKKGYLSYCSVTCSSNSEKTREKYKQTCLNRYGFDNVSFVDDVKKKKESTFYDKYGVSTYLQTDRVKEGFIDKYGVDNPFKLKDIQERIKNTNIKKYGHICPLQSEVIKEKTKKTNISKYGVDHFSKTDTWKKNIKSLNLELYIKSLFLSDNYQFISKNSNVNVIKHIDCGNVFEIQTQLLRLRKNKDVEICKHCNKINYHCENSLFSFIESIYSGEILKFRDKKYEIDVYLPELKIGFEFNGLYWHSELFKDSDYHINKIKYFKKIGIRIINIWEDDWLHKSDIIKSIIKTNIGLIDNRIFARKCRVSKISDKECRDFLKNNHIQGWCVSKHRYALIYNDEIVSVLTAGLRRMNLGYKKNSVTELEILRFCNKLNTNVVGGFSKLFKYLLNEIEFNKIITYSDLSMFTGYVYIKNGFNFVGESKPGYHYIVDGLRRNRFCFNKSKLIKMGFDKNKTEREIMFDNNYYRIYDCGNSKFEYES